MRTLMTVLLFMLATLAYAYDYIPSGPVPPTPYENAQQQQSSYPPAPNMQQMQQQQREEQIREDEDKAALNYNSLFGNQ